MENASPDRRMSILDYVAQVPDPRKARGIRHPLHAVLALICCATIAGARGFRAIAQWGRQHAELIGPALGFTRKPPCHSNFHYILADLDAAAFEAAIAAWMRDQGVADEALAIDGKTLRGSRDGEVPGVHLLSAFAAEASGVLAQIAVDNKTNEAKAVLELLELIPVKGKVFTMDAMFTQKDICRKIHDGGGDYVVQVKENQPTLRQNIEDAFAPCFSPLGATRA
jgi:hypothetical protein